MLPRDIRDIEMPVTLEHRRLAGDSHAPIRDPAVQYDDICRIDARAVENFAWR
jgi:hypothetical protein